VTRFRALFLFMVHGVRFVNPTEQELEGYKTSMRAVSGAPGRYVNLREGERQHAQVYCVLLSAILRHCLI
jgi:hypothetical protein